MVNYDHLGRQAQEFIKQRINRVIETYEDPELIQSILDQIDDYGRFHVLSAWKRLAVSKETFDAAMIYMREHGLLNDRRNTYHDKEGDMWLSDRAIEYCLETRRQEPFKIIEKHHVGKASTEEIIKAASNDLVFEYSKEFTFPLKTLRRFRDEQWETIQALRKKEAHFFYTTLGLPHYYGQERMNQYDLEIGEEGAIVFDKDKVLPTFVDTYDPTTKRENNLERDVNSFTLIAHFSSPQEAFEIGFDEAEGVFITDAPLDILLESRSKKTFYRVLCIKRQNRLFDVSMNNPYNFRRCLTLDQRKEVLPRFLQMQQRLEEILSN